MCGDRFTGEGSGKLSRIPWTKEKTLITDAPLSAMPKDTRQRLQPAEHPGRLIRSDIPQANLLKQLGKRKWRPTKEDYGPNLFVERLEDNYSISLTSGEAPVALSAKRLRERQDLRPKVMLDAVAYLPGRYEDGVEWSRKRVCRYPAASSHDQQRRVLNDVQPSVNNYSHQPTGVTSTFKDVSSLGKLYEATERVQRHVLTEATTDRVMKPLPTHELESDHPLSKLKWPFEGGFGDIETNRRGGGGGGSQPSTTGSQGFPQFITAGPSVSLFGHDLFGYDRESLLEYSSWA